MDEGKFLVSMERKNKCSECKQTFDRAERLSKHQKSQKIKCPHCRKFFCNTDTYEKHIRSIQTPIPDIPDINQRIQPGTLYEGDAGFQAVRLGKLHEISDWSKEGKYSAIINKAINHKFTYRDLDQWLIEIYQKRKIAFKINIAFGFVLYNPLSDEFRYFYASENNMLFDRAYTIDSMNAMQNFMRKIVAIDLPTNCYLSKPSSGWVLSSITNVQAKITDLPGVLLT